MPSNQELILAKEKLDNLLNISRIHFYKPTQIAEILYHYRVGKCSPNIDLQDKETYRKISKQWRDAISSRLVGSVSTSSAKYQDDVFSETAMPPRCIKVLSQVNNKGIVENYIYNYMASKLGDVFDAFRYLKSGDIEDFKIQEFLGFFEEKPGLKRSVDKAYEIVVYALFSAIINELQVTVNVSIANRRKEILEDFRYFISDVLGINQDDYNISYLAKIHRAGVTNAADKGLDIWSNFGPAIQVKHLRLDPAMATEIHDEISSDKLVIVCLDADKKLIESLLSQLGKTIYGIISLSDLKYWYDLCFTKYKDGMGRLILHYLVNEFSIEFPILSNMESFLIERSYNSEDLVGFWEIG